MNFRRWFAWACLALVVIAEVALFCAYRDRDGLQTALNNTQAELRQLTTERDAQKNSNAVHLATARTALERLSKFNSSSDARHWATWLVRI